MRHRFGSTTEKFERSYKETYKELSRLERSKLRKLIKNVIEYEAYDCLSIISKERIYSIEMLIDLLDMKQSFIRKNIYKLKQFHTITIAPSVKKRIQEILEQQELVMLTQELKEISITTPEPVASAVDLKPITVTLALDDITYLRAILTQKLLTFESILLGAMPTVFLRVEGKKAYHIDAEFALKMLSQGVVSKDTIMSQQGFKHDPQFYRYIQSNPEEYQKILYMKEISKRRPQARYLRNKKGA